MVKLSAYEKQKEENIAKVDAIPHYHLGLKTKLHFVEQTTAAISGPRYPHRGGQKDSQTQDTYEEEEINLRKPRKF